MDIMEVTTENLITIEGMPHIIIDKEPSYKAVWWTYHDHDDGYPILEQGNATGGLRVSVPVFPLLPEKQTWLEEGFPGYTKIIVTEGDCRAWVGYFKTVPLPV